MLSRAIRPVISSFSGTRCLLISCLFRRKIASTENGLKETISQQANWKQPYTASEDDIILQGRQKRLKWSAIASKIGRSIDAAKTRFHGHLKEHPDGPPSPRWSAIQETSIIQSKHNGENWAQAAARIGRSPKAVRLKYYERVPRPSRKKRRGFSTEEDLSLLQFRETEHRNWADIGRLLARSPVTVRARYLLMYKHRTKENRGSDQAPRRFSKAEDEKLLRLRDKEGLIFREVALRLGRPYPSVTERYHWLTADKNARLTNGPATKYTEAEDRRTIQ